MKRKKTNYLVVALIVILLVIAVGYAAFAQTLKITGTVVASANWDIHFEDPAITGGARNGESVTLSKLNTTDPDNTKLNVAVKLTKPGDKRTVTVNIVNDGTIEAKLNKITVKSANGDSVDFSTINGETETIGAIEMKLIPDTNPEGGVLAAEGGTLAYTLEFSWPSTYTGSGELTETASFEVTFDYQQNV